ncbi:MAG: hypothetical protein NWT04_13560 [Verrucomicrobiales bacterium]|nr:hypothetical protein [Verrucomicrobiales bacterium]
MALVKAPAAYAQVTPAGDPATTAAALIKPVEIREIPDRFFAVQDSSGFFWQAFGNGALVSGDAQYLQSGLNLLVDGVAFAPGRALVREPQAGAEKIDLRLEEKRADLTVSRDLWFDTRRSAVRVFDTFTNTSAAAKTVTVSLRTTYPFAWQSLHGTGGGLLSNDPALQLGARDYSLCVHFSPSEGRHDTLFVMGSEKGGEMAELKASANSREFTFVYPLEIAAGESRSLLHWIMQRNLPDVSQDLAALSPFIQRDRLIVPEVDPNSSARVANFAPTAFQIEATAPAQIKALVALNRLTDRIGFHRRSEDIMWMSPTNQIAGTVKREGSLTIGTAYTGEQQALIADIAAIRGAAGNGRDPMVYLRDGRVLAGPIRSGEIAWSIGATITTPAAPALAEPVDSAMLNLLLLATGPSDGVAPAKTTHFLQLIDGTVLPIVASTDLAMDLTAPWGEEKWLWSDLVEAGQISLPSPRLRVVHRNGSEVSALLTTGTWSLTTAAGTTVEIPTSAIDRLWTAGIAGLARLTGNPAGTPWLDFAEVPKGQGPSTGFLLAGNQLIDAAFAGEKIALSEGGREWQVETARIVSLRRSPEPDAHGIVEVELDNGEKLSGRFSAPYLALARNGVELEIPGSWVLGYRKAKP